MSEGLSSRTLVMWHVLWALGLAPVVVAGVALAVAAGAADEPALAVAGAIAAVLAAVASVVVPRLRHRAWRWQITDEGIEQAHGVVVRVTSAVPAFRVQQIDVRQGPVERWFGVVSLHIATASAGSDGVLPGLDAERAEEVRRRLLARVATDDGV